ncbi:MAG TPA: hydrogenase formation protein HypD, partial [bacterium]
TPNRFLDKAVALARVPDVLVATFGDMMRVPGSSSSLERERAAGGDVRVVFSTLDALVLAETVPSKQIVFLGVGFETTVPTTAVSILEAQKRGLERFSLLSNHKVMPPALEALSKADDRVNGYLLPGHVSAVIGTKPYEKLAREFGIGCVVSGFEPVDILQSILMLVRQAVNGRPSVEVQYSRVVKPEGNPKALAVLEKVFETADAEWRGLGNLPESGLQIRNSFSEWDAEKRIPIEPEPSHEPEGCRCGDVLVGKIQPPACPLFGSTCTPDEPVGACMVSSEGTCAAYFRFDRFDPK